MEKWEYRPILYIKSCEKSEFPETRIEYYLNQIRMDISSMEMIKRNIHERMMIIREP